MSLVRYLQHFKLQHLLSLSLFSLQTTWTASRWRWVVCWRSCTAPVKSSSRGSSRADYWQLKITSNVSVCHRSWTPAVSHFRHFYAHINSTTIFLSYPVFLSSELQAAQISQCGRVANTQDSSPGHQELLAICSTLSLPEAAGQDAAGVLSQVREAVGTRPVSFEWPVHEVYWHLVVRNHIASNAVLRNMTNPWADSCFIHVKNMYVFFFNFNFMPVKWYTQCL